MWWLHRSDAVADSKLDLLQGTLDLMVLQTLDVMGPLHGYGIGSVYASLVRLQQRGWISAEWGISDNDRKAKFYGGSCDRVCRTGHRPGCVIRSEPRDAIAAG